MASRAWISASISDGSATVRAISSRSRSRYRIRSRWAAIFTAPTVRPQLVGDALVRRGVLVAQESRPQPLVERPLVRPVHLGVEAGEDVVEQGQGPPPLEEPLGRQVVARLAAETRLRRQSVDRDRDPAAAAFDGPLPVVVPGQVVRAAGHQERAKPSPLRLQPAEVVAFQQFGEEALDQVLRRLRVVALAPDEGIEGIPVVAAESFQRRAGLGCGGVARLEDPAPAGRRESGG